MDNELPEVKLVITAPPEMVTAIANEVLKIIGVNGLNVKNYTGQTENNIVYTVKEAAEIAKVSKQTIRTHIDIGKITAYKPGKSWRITKQNLDNYVNGKPSNS